MRLKVLHHPVGQDYSSIIGLRHQQRTQTQTVPCLQRLQAVARRVRQHFSRISPHIYVPNTRAALRSGKRLAGISKLPRQHHSRRILRLCFPRDHLGNETHHPTAMKGVSTLVSAAMALRLAVMTPRMWRGLVAVNNDTILRVALERYT